MKKVVILVISLTFLVINTTFASINNVSESGLSYKINYPRVECDNNQVAKKINNDILQYVYAFKNDYVKGKFYEGEISYESKYEDNDYLSIIICDSRVYQANYRPQNKYIGLNYDKKSGNVIPLRYFVKVASDDNTIIRDCPLYNWAGEEINRYFIPDVNVITDNYFMKGGGEIALIYQVNARGCHADGMTYAVLNLKMIDYLNRKNP